VIFKQVSEINEGRKVMTQRVVKPGETAVKGGSLGLSIVSVLDRHGRTKWRVGQTYAIVPKRGAKGVGHIRLLRIFNFTLHSMSETDAKDEGVRDKAEYALLWDSINGKTKGSRWEDNPRVWVLKFEFVEPQS
jgi:hypothetical protein